MFCSTSEKDRKLLVPSKKQNFSSNCSCGHVECSFDKLVRKFREKAQKCSLIVRKRLKNDEKFSPQNVPMDTYNAVSTNLLQSFARRPKNHRSGSECDKKTSIKFFFSSFFYGHVDCNFDKPAKNVSPKDRKLSALYVKKRTNYWIN